MTATLQQPTSEQATSKAEVILADGRKGYCCWYPQMGGYVGIAIVIPTGDCFDVLVWHDGDFPFDDDDDCHDGPVTLHHCSAGQFISFGNDMRDFRRRSGIA